MVDEISVLYAEDDRDWSYMVKTGLEQNGFLVDLAADGNIAWQKLEEKQYDIVILDIDMPGKNGWELIYELKKIDPWLPIVLYTAHFTSLNFIDACGMGAEDFIAKGLELGVFSNRLKNLYTRCCQTKENANVIRISRLTSFSPDNGVLRVGMNSEIMKRNETKLLNILCCNLNKEVSKEDLCFAIWGNTNVSNREATLRNAVVEVRKYLLADSSVTIKNKRWGGYTLIVKD